jgi:hypothetical protein
MATWATERTTLAAALTAVFKKTGTGAYQYTQVDTDISSETNIPIGQKARHFRIEAKTVEISDLTSGKVLGRYKVEITLYFITAKFDYESYKSEVFAHINTLLNTYNYNIINSIECTQVSDRQAETKFTLEVGLSS